MSILFALYLLGCAVSFGLLVFPPDASARAYQETMIAGQPWSCQLFIAVLFMSALWPLQLLVAWLVGTASEN